MKKFLALSLFLVMTKNSYSGEVSSLKSNQFFMTVLSNLKEKLPIDFQSRNIEELFFSVKAGNYCNRNQGYLGRFHRNRILINENLITDAKNGDSPCLPKLSLNQLKSTIVHELAHWYLKEKRINIEKDKWFSALGNWKNPYKSRNRNDLNSPDPYEFENIEESYAVNFEYFILDREYKCRRPSYYNYFSNKHNFNPRAVRSINCEDLPELRNSEEGEIVKLSLDPDSIYEIHYLHGLSGKSIASRWGHSMFRVIVCAPHRKVISKDCLKDLDHHVVIGFLALIDSPSYSNLGGVMGEYPSYLNIRSMNETLRMYLEDEMRDLESYPIKMNREEIKNFVNRSIEMYFTYRGKYFFLTNNCATEGKRLLGVSLDNKSILAQRLITPNGFLKGLKRLKLINEEPVQNSDAKRNGYIFSNKAGRLSLVYSKSLYRTSQKNDYKDLDDFIEKSKAAERYEDLLIFPPIRNEILKLISLERHILESKIKNLSDVILIDFLENNPENSIVEDLLKNTMRLVFGTNNSYTYGIPKRREQVSFGSSEVLYHKESFQNFRENLQEISSPEVDSLKKEIEKIEDNIKFLQGSL